MDQPNAQPIGYGAVAAVMSSDRDLSIYRRFGGLNARNLLYLQSELLELETRLHELDVSANDMQKGITTWSVPRSWRSLEREGGEHLQIVLRIRELLEKYNEALRAQAWLLSLKRPAQRPSTNLLNYIRDQRSDMSQSDVEFMADKHRLDRVALSREEKELMSHFLEKNLFWLFKSKEDKERAQHGPIAFYSEGRVRTFVRFLAIIVSSVLPILSIVALYYIPTQAARLGAIAGFSALCSATLSLVTAAKNIEIIAATAAYAAVQVVFVSGSIPTNSS